MWNARPKLDQINFNTSFKSLFVNYTGQTFPVSRKYLIQDWISLCTFQFPILGLVLSMVVTYWTWAPTNFFFSSTRKPQQIFWFAALVVIIVFICSFKNLVLFDFFILMFSILTLRNIYINALLLSHAESERGSWWWRAMELPAAFPSRSRGSRGLDLLDHVCTSLVAPRISVTVRNCSFWF